MILTNDTSATGLRSVRTALGISQAELARRLKLHPSLVSRVERGRVESWPKFRRDAAEALGVPEAVLFRPER